jgi:hypothetical protein
MLRCSIPRCGSRVGAHLEDCPHSWATCVEKGYPAMLSLLVELLRRLGGNTDPDGPPRREWVLD